MDRHFYKKSGFEKKKYKKKGRKLGATISEVYFNTNVLFINCRMAGKNNYAYAIEASFIVVFHGFLNILDRFLSEKFRSRATLRRCMF